MSPLRYVLPPWIHYKTLWFRNCSIVDVWVPVVEKLKASLGGILYEVKWLFGVNGVFVVHPSTFFPWVDCNWCWRTFHESIVIDVDGGGYERPTCIILFLNDHSSLSVMGHDNYCVVCLSVLLRRALKNADCSGWMIRVCNGFMKHLWAHVGLCSLGYETHLARGGTCVVSLV